MRFRIENRQTDASLRRPLFSFSSFVLATVVGLVSSFTFSTAYDMAYKKFSGGPQTISGVWQGRWHGVPAVTIRLEQNGEALGGTARFSRIIATADGPEAVGETVELPLLNPRLEGQRLSFEVRGADETQTAVVAEMEMKFVNEGEAELRYTDEQSEGEPKDDKAMGIKMKRERSF